ncbi:MAG: hypothetical protein DRG37_00930 [Deltaproteobacteria bacterium]|nr:MAG: hypothetical protein DRG37_00930 [Deltaproteobacteria bacterium]
MQWIRARAMPLGRISPGQGGDMQVKTSQDNGQVIIKVSGNVDTKAAEELRSELARVLQMTPTKVTMNLKMVPSIGSSGIGKILVFFKELNKRQASFEIKGIQENIHELFKAIKLDKLFPITKA